MPAEFAAARLPTHDVSFRTHYCLRETILEHDREEAAVGLASRAVTEEVANFSELLGGTWEVRFSMRFHWKGEAFYGGTCDTDRHDAKRACPPSPAA